MGDEEWFAVTVNHFDSADVIDAVLAGDCLPALFVAYAERLFHFYVLGVCRIRTRLCEGRRPSSILGENTF